MDPTELFDDIEKDSTKQPDIVVDECEDTTEMNKESDKGGDNAHLLPIENFRKHTKLENSDSDKPSSDLELEGASLYTVPSLCSVISVHNETEPIRGKDSEVCM